MKRIIPLLLIVCFVNLGLIPIKKDTSKTVLLGAFISNTDGKTRVTDLTNARVTIKIRKNGGSSTTLSSNGLENECDGYYKYTIPATATDTVGVLYLDADNSGCLPYFMAYEIVTEYDNTDLGTIKTNINTANSNITTNNNNILINQSKLVTLQEVSNDTKTDTTNIITTQGTHTTTLNTIYEKSNDTYNAVSEISGGIDYTTILNNIWDKQNDTYDNTNTINNKIDRIRK